MNPNERMLRVLQASAEQLAAIDRVLDGTWRPGQERPERKGPLTMMVHDAADYLGVHRATIRRLMRAGRLTPVEILGGIRVRREELEALAGANQERERRAET